MPFLHSYAASEITNAINIKSLLESLSGTDRLDASAIKSIISIPAPDWTSPDIWYYDTGNIMVKAGRYFAYGPRFGSQYYDTANASSYWDVSSDFTVDIDAAGTIVGGDTEGWYSLFLTGTSSAKTIPFVRIDTIDYNSSYTGKTTITPASHSDGTTQNDNFVASNDDFNGYRAILLKDGAANYGRIFTIEDTVNGTPDQIIFDGDQTPYMAVTDWLYLAPPTSTLSTYLGCYYILSDGTIRRFKKTKWDYEYTPSVSVTANGHASALANTEVGIAIPPTARTAAFHYLAGQNGGSGVASVDLQIAYGTDGNTDAFGKGYMNVNTWDSYKRYAACFPGKIMTSITKIRNLARGWSNVPEPDAFIAAELATMYFWGFGE